MKRLLQSVLLCVCVVAGLYGCGFVYCVSAQETAPKAGATPEVPKKELLYESPAQGSTVSGTIQIVVKPVNFKPKAFVVIALQSTHVALKPSPNEPGKWIGTFDTTLVPNGPVRLYFESDVRNISPVETNFDRVLRLNVQNPTKIFFGDVHAHTSYSDGSLIPSIAMDFAKDVQKLDFFILTDHFQRMTRDEWLDEQETVSKYNVNKVFTTLPAFEWRDKVNTSWHLNVFNAEEIDWPHDYEGIIEKAAKNKVVLQFNHPAEGAVFNGMAFHPLGDTVIQLYEVRRPTEEIGFLRALNNGWHIAPVGSDDMHGTQWGTKSWTGVHIPALTRINLMDALRKRNLYSTADRNCELHFSINDAVLGSVAKSSSSQLTCKFRIADPDNGDAIENVELISNEGVVLRSFQPKKNSIEEQFEIEQQKDVGERFYYLRVKQADGEMMWSAPIWITVVESTSKKR